MDYAVVYLELLYAQYQKSENILSHHLRVVVKLQSENIWNF